MKKPIKATALLLAVTMTLTACRSENQVGNLEKEYKEYMNAAVTEVEDMPYALNKVKGTYSGEWKGNRPEGEGTLWLNDDEYYYSENWVNGDINGYGEIKRFDGNGKLKHYKGECSYSQPSGKGTMEIGVEGEDDRMVVDGDFSDLTSLLYFMLDADGRCTDLVGCIRGEYESYVGNPNVTGMEYLMDRPFRFKSRTGYYIGQINEEGLPDGYGYYSEVCELEDSIFGELKNQTFQTLGSWKNGKVEGYFTESSLAYDTKTKFEKGFWGNTIKKNFDVTNTTKREGYMENDKMVGNYIISTGISSDPPRPDDDGVVIKTMDFDTFELVTLRIAYDNSQTCEWRHMISEYDSDMGEFVKYDANGNMTIHKIQENRQWTTLMNKERDAIDARNRMMEKVGSITGPVITFGLLFGMTAVVCDGEMSKGAQEMIDNARNSAQRALADRDQYNDIKEKVESEIKSGHYDEARKLQDEAKDYEYAVAWWDKM